jgi:nitrous oxidase accessory protein NosD
MTRTLRLAAILTTTLVSAVGLAAPASAAPDDPPTAPTYSEQDAQRQAALVLGEDRRLITVRAVAAVAPLRGGQTWTKPYRLSTGSGYTLVLTQRSDEYTVTDLLALAPQTFVRQPDGSYLLTENIYLNAGAKLRLSNPGGLTLRMASNSNGFVSIVSFGGRLTFEGTPQAPTVITSWDPRTRSPDTDVRDGRAYIRAIGGTFAMSYTTVSDLGFWSGRTGGLSLTGTDRPSTGSTAGPAPHLTKDQRHQDNGTPAPGDGPAAPGDQPGFGGVYAQPAGPLSTPDSDFTVPGQSYVSGQISHSTISGNAFGLFVSSATGINISDTTVSDSLEDGVVMHRFASSAVLERVTSRHNGRTGFVLSRATSEVHISGATAEDNGENGFTLSGQPLATGPSASGQSVATYGSNSVSNSVVRDNARYGIEILGGLNVGVQNNEIDGGDMGIVARQGAHQVAITGNELHGQRRQGIAVRDGVTAATVTGNVVQRTETGIYVRDSAAEVRGNTVQDVTDHGIAVIGHSAGSTARYNVVAGVGPSAIDTSRDRDRIEVSQNQTFAWHDTSSFWVRFRHYASPMTLLWTSVLLLVLASALGGGRSLVRRRQSGGDLHPYADKRPLHSAPPRELAAGLARALVMAE